MQTLARPSIPPMVVRPFFLRGDPSRRHSRKNTRTKTLHSVGTRETVFEIASVLRQRANTDWTIGINAAGQRSKRRKQNQSKPKRPKWPHLTNSPSLVSSTCENPLFHYEKGKQNTRPVTPCTLANGTIASPSKESRPESQSTPGPATKMVYPEPSTELRRRPYQFNLSSGLSLTNVHLMGFDCCSSDHRSIPSPAGNQQEPQPRLVARLWMSDLTYSSMDTLFARSRPLGNAK